MAEIATHVLGCKVNFADIQAIAGSLPSHDLPVALVGTCCVTAEGEKQSRKEVRRAARRVGPGGKVYVAGCAARRNPAAFREIGENIIVIDGMQEAREKTDEVFTVSGGLITPTPTLPPQGGGSETVAHALQGGGSDDGVRPLLMEGSEAGPAISSERRTRFFLKVQDGCANRCAYCVIPQVRGRPRSIPINQIISSAAAAVAAGYPELVVTGINVGAYRDREARLPQLLEALAGLDGLKRLRLSSIEINHVTEELLGVWRYPVMARHLHLPLQSGDNGVLESMGRRYRREEFSRRVEAARDAVPEINVTTDVIVGFPAEDEKAFAHTLEFLEATGFTKAHVFAYSPRPGVPAEGVGDPVPPAEKNRRSRLARALSGRLQNNHRQRKVGGLSEILLESSRPGGIHCGYSSDYTRFLVKGGCPGELVTVRARDVTDEGVWGEPTITDCSDSGAGI